MSFRLSFPLDGRAHREEDTTAARLAHQQRGSRQAPQDASTPVSAAGQPESSRDTSTPSVTPALQQRRVVFPDPVAFRYLEEDAGVTVVERRGVLQGYELYLVEQWACSRQSPTLVIVSYTGDPKQSLVAGVLGVPADEKDWSPRLRVYFKAIQQYHARPKDTELGELMVTNLSSFPSALTVIPVPDGDIRAHRQVFIVNENLKRLGCSGRSGLTLSDPTPATQAKFLQLYKTSDRNPFFQSVLELIKLCQVALFLFGKLDQTYIDGLLCDITESAVSDWWTEVGSEYYNNFEPTDGILGPTTVAALLGTLMGARNRLNWYNAPVAKDVFDIESTKRGIGYFQKTQKLEKTRRLDRQTLLKLHRVTAKAAAGEGWGVPKAVKSTMAEFGGKRGEIVMGMVGGRDKAGISEIETLDMDKFINLASGERAKWLWYAKPRKTAVEHHERSLPDIGDLLFGKEEAGAQPAKWTSSAPVEEDDEERKRAEPLAVYANTAPGSAVSVAESPGEKDALHKTVLKSVAGKMSDARSGLGRIKDAVGGGLRGHASRPSRDDFPDSGYTSTGASGASGQSSSAVYAPVGRAFTWKNKPEEYLGIFKKDGDGDPTKAFESSIRGSLQTGREFDAGVKPPLATTVLLPAASALDESLASEVRRDGAIAESSIAVSVADDYGLQQMTPFTSRRMDTTVSALGRRHSTSLTPKRALNEDRWPRHMSFGHAEEAVLRWDEVSEFIDEGDEGRDTKVALIDPARTAEAVDALCSGISALQNDIGPWVLEKLGHIDTVETRYSMQQEELKNLYYKLSDECRLMKQNSRELVAKERSQLTESIKDIEVLVTRLEYEIDALVSRVRDVEEGVGQFEQQVEEVERRAEELKVQLETEGWLHWLVRTVTGIGTGPNIIRSL